LALLFRIIPAVILVWAGPALAAQPAAAQVQWVQDTTVPWKPSELVGLAAFSASDVWIAVDGAHWHFDGKQWTKPTDKAAVFLLGGGKSGLWGMGPTGGYWKHQAAGWRSTGFEPGVFSTHMWGSGPKDVYAVGAEGWLARFDGTAWTTFEDVTPAHLLFVDGTSSSDVWAGGLQALLHFDGKRWTAVDGPGTYVVMGIRALAKDDVWVVGAIKGADFLGHYDGRTWSYAPFPDRSPRYVLDGRAPCDVWLLRGNEVLHYDGKQWSPATGNLVAPGREPETLFSPAVGEAWVVTSTGELFKTKGVGGGGTCAPSAQRKPVIAGTTGTMPPPRDLKAWRASTPGHHMSAAPTALWGSGPDQVWAAGQRNMLQFNGTGWNIVTGVKRKFGHIRSVAGTGRTDVWAVSNDKASGAGPGGAILHFDGQSWEKVYAAKESTEDFRAVWSSEPNVVWVAGVSNILRFEPRTRVVTKVWDGNMAAFWGSSPSDVWSVGANGAIAHYDGTRWWVTPSGQYAEFTAVHGTDAEHVWAVGMKGAAAFFDGKAWNTLDVGLGAVNLVAVWAQSPSAVWIADASGNITHFNGSAWIPEVTLPGTVALWGTPGTLYAATTLGVLSRALPAPASPSPPVPPPPPLVSADVTVRAAKLPAPSPVVDDPAAPPWVQAMQKARRHLANAETQALLDAALKTHDAAPSEREPLELLAAIYDVRNQEAPAREVYAKLKALPPAAAKPPSPETPVDPAVKPGRTAYVSGARINVRATPDAAATLVTKLEVNTAVKVVDLQGEWARISPFILASGAEAKWGDGFVKTNLLASRRYSMDEVMNAVDVLERVGDLQGATRMGQRARAMNPGDDSVVPRLLRLAAYSNAFTLAVDLAEGINPSVKATLAPKELFGLPDGETGYNPQRSHQTCDPLVKDLERRYGDPTNLAQHENDEGTFTVYTWASAAAELTLVCFSDQTVNTLHVKRGGAVKAKRKGNKK